MPKEMHAPDGKTFWWSLTAALTLHLIAGIALFDLSVERPLPSPQAEAVAVEFLVSRPPAVPAPPSDRTTRSAPPTVAHRSSQSAEEAPEPGLDMPPKTSTGTMIRARRFFSSEILADPRSRNARKALQQLSASERIVQLCNVEAMEQVHRWKAEFQPDFLVAYAMADTVQSGRVLEADGGALRSKANWYNIKYRCEVSPDLSNVDAFEFSVGKEIPRDEWEGHALSADDGPAD